MEIIIAVLIGALAFGAVLRPLLRRSGAEARAATRPANPPARHAEATSSTRPTEAPTPPADAAAPGGESPDVAGHGGDPAGYDDPVEAEVLRYRAAIRAGTVCRRCSQANPAGSRFCSECGNRIAAA